MKKFTKKDIKWVAFGIIAVVLVLVLVSSNNRPEFFDIFGLLTFTYLFIVGIWMFHRGKNIPNWIRFPILIIGVLGFIVDGYIVVKTFILG